MYIPKYEWKLVRAEHSVMHLKNTVSKTTFQAKDLPSRQYKSILNLAGLHLSFSSWILMGMQQITTNVLFLCDKSKSYLNKKQSMMVF